MRRKARVDTNQAQVVKELKQAGVSVLHTHQLGEGAPDIIVGYGHTNLLVELKDPDKPPSKRRLTPDEQEFFDTWRGEVIVAHRAEDILGWFGIC